MASTYSAVAPTQPREVLDPRDDDEDEDEEERRERMSRFRDQIASGKTDMPETTESPRGERRRGGRR